MTTATVAASILATLLVHEAGHFTTARALGYPARLARYGTATKWGSAGVLAPAVDRALVSMAGPLASLLLAAVCWFAGFDFAGTASLVLTLVTLAPLPGSDGFHAYAATRRYAAR